MTDKIHADQAERLIDEAQPRCLAFEEASFLLDALLQAADDRARDIGVSLVPRPEGGRIRVEISSQAVNYKR